MQLPSTLTDEQSEAVIAVLIEFARHGRAIRLAREQAEQKMKSPSNLAGAGDSVNPTVINISKEGVYTDANQS
jgi:hypothetical protein